MAEVAWKTLLRRGLRGNNESLSQTHRQTNQDSSPFSEKSFQDFSLPGRVPSNCNRHGEPWDSSVPKKKNSRGNPLTFDREPRSTFFLHLCSPVSILSVIFHSHPAGLQLLTWTTESVGTSRQFRKKKIKTSVCVITEEPVVLIICKLLHFQQRVFQYHTNNKKVGFLEGIYLYNQLPVVPN